jgi:actin
LSFVALDYNDALKKYNEGSPEFEKRFELPDGNIITLDRERF